MDENKNVGPYERNTKLSSAYVSRCERKKRPYNVLKIKTSGGLFDLCDNTIKGVYRITDDEYDYLSEMMTEGELSYMVGEEQSFGEKKICLRILEKHLSNYYVKYGAE